ncbi:hypothetical protein [Intestinirhabdus alba]|jgi:hypothetical protein|uniref:FidL n=1 Tax=Intestinirhabdus alba TaxID=2899544 RepID=A0A6L6IQ42_9ENTR|nr:hypothetical protein [Intestinirhabdus alba]MTH47120.1 hypothetical protein [Intestinirhabdus alba]
MPNRIAIVVILIVIMLIGSFLHYLHQPQFKCESQFTIAQQINQDRILSEGIISMSMTDKNLLIGIDGLVTHNNEKYIISRTLKAKYKKYDAGSHLYKLLYINIIRDDTDNINDKIANNLLFTEDTDNRIIFIKESEHGIILFGNHNFPQYGCRKK